MSETALPDAELATRRRLRNAMLLFFGVVAILVALAVAFWPQGDPSPVIALEDVAVIEFEFQQTSAGQTGMHGGASKPEFYGELIDVLSTGRESPDHKCADTGRILIKLRDGSELHYGTLSGHNERFYEFRAYDERRYKLYRVPRERMASALKKLGIATIDEPRPE